MRTSGPTVFAPLIADENPARPRAAVVVPCYRVREKILDVIGQLGPEVERIFVVDDACPESTGQHVRKHCADPRVEVLFHEVNQGVGGATLTGLRRALEWGADIIVKIDGDDQMDLRYLPAMIGPIADGEADYVKGNRFFDPRYLTPMPLGRRLGNLALSFLSKASSGLWHIFDPTNGFVAIHASVARLLPFDRIASRYFFESDMLFHLSLLDAKILDVPMPARYGNERSGINVVAIIPEFLMRHAKNGLHRILLTYFVRDFNVGSIQLSLGLVLFTFGVLFGAKEWIASISLGQPATAGTVMLAGLPTLLGVQMLQGFLSYDLSRATPVALQRRLLPPLVPEAGPGV